MTNIPRDLQPVLWSQDVKSLDLKKDKVYIIHQVLSYGSLDNLKWLFKIYPKPEIKKIFVKYPSPIYTPPSLNLVKKMLLGLDRSVDEKRYIKSVTDSI